MSSTEDHSIVVRLWLEPGDPSPRARLRHLPSGAETTAAGVQDIVAAFDTMVRRSVTDPGHATRE